MQRRLLLALACGLMFGHGLLACDGLTESEPKTVRSADGRSEIVIPGIWARVRNLHDEAGIQVGNPFSGYAIVLSELKFELPEDLTLAEYMDTVTGNMANGEAGAGEPSRTVSLTIQGRPALQRQIRTEAGGDRVRMLITVVDGPKMFHQLIAWTDASDFDSRVGMLQEMVRSFREIEPRRRVPGPRADSHGEAS